MKSKDIYDKEVARLSRLLKKGESLNFAWAFGVGHSPLFDNAGPLRGEFPRGSCGCLTQVHAGTHEASNKKLTKAIRADNRLVDDAAFIHYPDQLKVFAEWQRKLDKMFKSRRKPRVGPYSASKSVW